MATGERGLIFFEVVMASNGDKREPDGPTAQTNSERIDRTISLMKWLITLIVAGNLFQAGGQWYSIRDAKSDFTELFTAAKADTGAAFDRIDRRLEKMSGDIDDLKTNAVSVNEKLNYYQQLEDRLRDQRAEFAQKLIELEKRLREIEREQP